MPSPEQRDQFTLYKDDVERRGKSFYPHAMFHDTVMSLVVVSVIVGLACLWYFTSSERPADAGVLGPRYHEEADPGTTSFIPRPDWYFFFLFYLLRIFKWPESVFLGTVGIPTILLILLLAPLDRGAPVAPGRRRHQRPPREPARRRPRRAPVSGVSGRSLPAASGDHGGDETPSRTTIQRCRPISAKIAPGSSSMWMA